MSTVGRLSARQHGDTDHKSSDDGLKTAQSVAIRHGAQAVYLGPSQLSQRSASDQLPRLTESEHLRNRDTRQVSSECPSQSISLSGLEKPTAMEAIPQLNNPQSTQRRSSNLNRTSSSTLKHRETDDRSALPPHRAVLQLNHPSHNGVQEPQEGREGAHLLGTTQTPASKPWALQASMIWETDSRNASTSPSSSAGQLKQHRSSATGLAISAVEARLCQADPLHYTAEDLGFPHRPVPNQKKTTIHKDPIFATWHYMDTAQAAESREQPPAPPAPSPTSANSNGSGKILSSSHITQAGGSAGTSQFQYTPPSTFHNFHSSRLNANHLDEPRELHRAATPQRPTTPLPALCPISTMPDPLKGHNLCASRSLALRSELGMMLDAKWTTSGHSREELADEADRLPPSLDALSASPTSPYAPSDGETTPEDYGTPFTSPCVSPAKSPSPGRHDSVFTFTLPQLDGGRDSIGSAADSPLEAPSIVDDTDEAHETSETIVEHVAEEFHRVIDLTEVDPEAQPSLELDIAPEDATPLTRASKAKIIAAFPFPNQISPQHQSSMLPAQRHPSRLLRFCEQSATPRQRQLMTGTLESPDRFIPGRSATPNKDAFLLRKPAKKRADPRRPAPAVGLSDPFGPSVSRSARMADRFATIRTPSTVHRPLNTTGTTVPDAVSSSRRAASTSAVWTVGGITVTEGIASTTDGRGGRVTSGTSAPHYTADFLCRQSPSEDEIQHGQRLALAMDVQPGARMIPRTSPLSTPPSTSPRRSSCSNVGSKRTVWNNNAWEKSSPTTPSKPPKKKPKDIPVIPFRVLDAPALRDDFYCSLLAYSPTAQCLAVSLGPHVYLWSETRGTTPTHIPDSLTAPFGAHVTSVSFSSVDGGKSILAIGRADGRITLWSPQDRDPRFNSEQPAPVSCVSFRPTTVNRPSVREPSMTVATEELLVGDEVGNVYYYSIEWPSPDDRDLFGWNGSMTLLARMSCHTQQICGIAWSKDGDLFATGGNDNQLLLFEPKKLFAKGRNGAARVPSTVRVRNGNANGSDNVAGQGRVMAITSGQHKHLFTLNAAVKAIAFAPWQPSLLAAGGGSNDRCIHFFHALSGATLATIDCHAQVTSLVWSEKKKEIAATFGFAQPDHPYRVAVFSWPSCQRVVSIPWWSEERALYAVAYPGRPSGGPAEDKKSKLDSEGRPWHGRRTRDEGCLVIATSDASIKFHEIWPEKSVKARREGAGGLLGGSMILEDSVSFELEREAAIR